MGESRDIMDESQYQWFIIGSVGYCVGNACGLIIYTLHTGTFIFMYRAQEIKCRLHGREWNKRFSWSGEAAKEREEIDFATRRPRIIGGNFVSRFAVAIPSFCLRYSSKKKSGRMNETI